MPLSLANNPFWGGGGGGMSSFQMGKADKKRSR